MTATLMTAYLGKGLAAARPVTPLVATGTIGYYYATDTGTVNLWDGAAWHVLSIADAGAVPAIVQSKIGFVTAAGLTLASAPINGNLLVAMTFNPTVGTVGAGWTAAASNGSGLDFGLIATKVAGVGESTTQNPLSASATGIIAMWELSGQNATPVVTAILQAEQASLQSIAPSFPNLKNCLALGCISLQSTSNNVGPMLNMIQDQIINTGTTRQGVMGHSDLRTAIGQPISNFSGAGTPANKSGLILITS